MLTHNSYIRYIIHKCIYPSSTILPSSLYCCCCPPENSTIVEWCHNQIISNVCVVMFGLFSRRKNLCGSALFPGQKCGKLPPVSVLTMTKSGFKPQTNAVISIKLLPTHYATPNFHAIIAICYPERRFERNNKLTKGQSFGEGKVSLVQILGSVLYHPSEREEKIRHGEGKTEYKSAPDA